MDKYIELIAFYWVDWQQTAIANTRYSVVLAVVAFFIGTFILSILKAGKIKKLQQQLLQNRQLLDEAKTANDDLVNKTNDNEKEIATLQQQIEELTLDIKQQSDQASNDQQQLSDNHKSEIAAKDALILKNSQDKQLEIDQINLKFVEKNELSEQLQAELDKQKDNIAQFAEVKSQVTTLEAQLTASTTELSSIKAQLDTELRSKDDLLIKIDKQEQATKTQIDRVLDLEGLLAEFKADKIKIEQALLDSVQNKPEIKHDIVESEAPPLVESTPEKTKDTEIVINKEPLVEQNKEVTPVKSVSKNTDQQGVAKTIKGWFSSIDKALEGDDSSQNKSESTVDKKEPDQLATPDIMSEPVQEKALETPVVTQKEPLVEKEEIVESVKAEQKVVPLANKESSKKSVANKVLGWFSSMDKALEGDSNPENTEITEASITEAANNVKNVKPDLSVTTESLENKVQETKQAVDILDEDDVSFSEKMADVADKMDAMQDKFKGFFNKK